MKRPLRAAELARAAADGFGTAGAPMDEALACHLAGAAHVAAGQPDRGREAFERAGSGYAACGAVWAATLLRGGAAPAPAVLTAREREIADLATTGLSNKEIAAHLYLSHRTVESHLNRIFTKLAVRSRTEMAHRLAGLSRSRTGS